MMSTIENNKEISRTTLHYEEINFDIPIPDYIFTKQNLVK